MYKHPIPESIPSLISWAGINTKLTNATFSSHSVPPVDGKEWRKNPIKQNAIDVALKDAYFLGQLIAVYQAGEFERGNLDTGRLNNLWCRDILVVVEDDKFRIELISAFDFLADLGGVA